MNIVVIGQGGHSKVIRDIILSSHHQIIGYLDDRYDQLKEEGSIFYGPVSAANEIIECFGDVKFVIAIGNNQVRKAISDRLGLDDSSYATLLHQTAVVSPTATLGYGTVVMANAVINADARIGNHAIINTGAIVEHDNGIGDYVHISPKAILTGSVTIEDGTHIGAAAVLIPQTKVGAWSIIGAGTTVINDLPPYCTAVGNPARVIKINSPECEVSI
jgi:acetyltransferase EpsM